jgi:O-antigen ligase
VFFTESTFRARKFTSAAPSLDAQTAVQLMLWGLAGLLGFLCGGLASRNIKGPTAICAIFLLLMLGSVSYSPGMKLTAVSAIGYGAFFAFALALRERCSDREILTGIGAGLSLLVLSAPILYFAHKEPSESLLESSNEGRIHGLTPHAGGLGALAALLIIISISILKSEDLGRWARRLWKLIALGSFGVVGLALAKTSIIALGISGLAMWWRRSAVLRALSPLWMLLVIAVGAAVEVVGVDSLVPHAVIQAVSRGTGSNLSFETLTGRLRIWMYVIGRIEQSPIFGYGFNTGRYVIRKWGTFVVIHCHSMYLQCLLYLGIVGFVFFLIMIAYLAVGFARRPLLWRDWIGIYLLILGLAEQSAFSNLPSTLTLCWFLVMAALRPRAPSGVAAPVPYSADSNAAATSH